MRSLAFECGSDPARGLVSEPVSLTLFVQRGGGDRTNQMMDNLKIKATTDRQSLNANPMQPSAASDTRSLNAPQGILPTDVRSLNAPPTTSSKTATETAALATKPGSSGSSKSAPAKIAPPTKRTDKAARKAALRVRDRFTRIPENQRTEQQKSSLKWAEGIIGGAPAPSKPMPSKRQRSLEEVPQPVAKKVCGNTTTPKLFSEIVAGHITIAVIDRSDPDGSISPERWRKVVVKMATIFIPIMKEFPGKGPSCRDSGWHQGHVKLIACADQRSVDLYKIAISRIGEVWPGAKLEVVDRDQIPNRPRARSRIPAEPSDPQTILELIRLGNHDLPTGNWKVTRVEEPKGDFRSATFVINQESLAILSSRGYVVDYGFTSIEMRVFKKDEALLEEEQASGPIKNDPSPPSCTPAPEDASSDTELAQSLRLSSLEDDLLKSDEESDITVVEVNPTTSSSNAESSTD